MSTTVRVVPEPSSAGPRPTGRVEALVDGRPVASGRLTPQATAALLLGELGVAGRSLTLRYSGDGTYDPSGGVTMRLPTPDVVTIVVRPIDRLPPIVVIQAPTPGAIYPRGEVVPARYGCYDVGGTVGGLAECEGTTPDGQPIDTSTVGQQRFTVHARDAAGNAGATAVVYGVVAVEGVPLPPAVSTPSLPALPAPPTVLFAGSVAGAPATGPAPTSPPVEEPQDGTRTSPEPASDEGSPRAAAGDGAPPAAGNAGDAGLAAYDARSEPVKVVGLMVAAFTLLQLGGRGGLSTAGAAAVVAAGRRRHSGRARGDGTDLELGYEGVDVEHLEAGEAEVKRGDRSRTWRLPGTTLVDALSAGVPVALATRSALLARIAADGSYLRAMLGAAALVPLVLGIVLGIVAVDDTGGAALPPALTLTIAIAVLGILDALAGFVAVLVFLAGVVALGGLDSMSSLRTLVGLAALWFVVPILAGAARPLRRPPPAWLEDTWDRAADFVIGSLIGAWAVQQIVLALPGLAGLDLPIAEHANSVAIAVLAALVARLAGETIAAHLYPARLAAAAPPALPEQARLPRLGAILLRTSIFVLLAVLVIGSSWQLWVAAVLFAVPQLLAVFENRLPNSPRLFGALPKGLAELVLMLVVASALGVLLVATLDESAETFLATSIVILSIPGFVLSLLALLGREGEQRALSWPGRFAGVGLLGLGVLLATGSLT